MFHFWMALSQTVRPSFIFTWMPQYPRDELKRSIEFPRDVERGQVVHDVQAAVMDDDFEPRLPPHEYRKGSDQDYIEAREGGVPKVASE
jgi:hypothetical protein